MEKKKKIPQLLVLSFSNTQALVNVGIFIYFLFTTEVLIIILLS